MSRGSSTSRNGAGSRSFSCRALQVVGSVFSLLAGIGAETASARLDGGQFVLAIHGNDAYAIAYRGGTRFLRRNVRSGASTRLAAFDSFDALSKMNARVSKAVAWVSGLNQTKSLVAVDRLGNARALENDADGGGAGLQCVA